MTAPGPGPAGAPPDGAAIAVRDLVKTYDGRDVVAGLSLDVHPGEILGLLGPNGAGKTTTVEIVEGYRRPDRGSVRVLGLDPVRDGRALRPRMGIMLQQGGLPPQVRVRELVRLYASFYRDPEDPDALLGRVGLSDAGRRRVKVLSGGEKQRLALALALVGRPEVALLDEPTAGMDPQAKAATRDVVSGLRDRGVPVLLTTHELADLERLADRIAIVDHGRLVSLGTPAELVAGVRRRLRFRIAGVLSAAGRAELAGALAAADGPAPGGSWGPGSTAGSDGTAGRPSVDEDGPGGAYAVEGIEPSPRVVSALAEWCRGRDLLLTEMRAAGGTLEERYLEIVGAAAGGQAQADAVGDRRGRLVSAPATLPRMVAAQAGMELRLTARRGENLFVTLVLPAALLAFFAAVPVLPSEGPSAAAFLLPGTLGLAIIATSFVNLGIATAFERGYGVLKRLGGSPLPRSGLLAAKVLAVAVVETVGVAILLAVALVLGWRPDPGISPAVIVAAAILGTFAFASLGLLLAGALRPEATLAIANAVFVLFLLVGGVILPIASLPEPLATVARALPSGALTDALRAGFSGTGDVLVPLVVLAAWGVVAAFVTARTFRWE